jgi:hypothetical protein
MAQGAPHRRCRPLKRRGRRVLAPFGLAAIAVIVVAAQMRGASAVGERGSRGARGGAAAPSAHLDLDADLDADVDFDDDPLVRGPVTPALLRACRRQLLLRHAAVAARADAASPPVVLSAGDDPLQARREAWEAARYGEGALLQRRRRALLEKTATADGALDDPALAPGADECLGGFGARPPSALGVQRPGVVECGQACREATCAALIQFYRATYNASQPWRTDFGAFFFFFFRGGGVVASRPLALSLAAADQNHPPPSSKKTKQQAGTRPPDL